MAVEIPQVGGAEFTNHPGDIETRPASTACLPASRRAVENLIPPCLSSALPAALVRQANATKSLANLRKVSDHQAVAIIAITVFRRRTWHCCGAAEAEGRRLPMANDEQVTLLKQGVAAWNAWRADNHDVRLDLIEANLSRADLKGANLSAANLSGADLKGANLHLANFRGANLRGANLTAANLRGAHLRGAHLRRATFCGAKLIEANLTLAHLTLADLTGADLKEANLRGANLSEANVSKVNLSGANLGGADLRGANLLKANRGGEPRLGEPVARKSRQSKLDEREPHRGGA